MAMPVTDDDAVRVREVTVEVGYTTNTVVGDPDDLGELMVGLWLSPHTGTDEDGFYLSPGARVHTATPRKYQRIGTGCYRTAFRCDDVVYKIVHGGDAYHYVQLNEIIALTLARDEEWAPPVTLWLVSLPDIAGGRPQPVIAMPFIEADGSGYAGERDGKSVYDKLDVISTQYNIGDLDLFTNACIVGGKLMVRDAGNARTRPWQKPWPFDTPCPLDVPDPDNGFTP